MDNQTINKILNAEKLPEKIKLDLATPLERVFMWITILFITITVIGIFVLLDSGWTQLVKRLLLVGCLGTVVFVKFLINTDNFYILDIAGQRLQYHYKFYLIRKVSQVAYFTEFASITVGGKSCNSKEETWWEYQILLITRYGKVIALSEFDKNFTDRCQLAERLAQITGASYVVPVPGTIAKASTDRNGRHSFAHVPATYYDSFKRYCTTVIIGVAVLTGTVALAMVLSFY